MRWAPGIVLLLLACASEAKVSEPKPSLSLGAACTDTLECAEALHCSAGQCAEPANPSEKHSAATADIEREIAKTLWLEQEAFTFQGKERMQAKRAELEAELAKLRAQGSG